MARFLAFLPSGRLPAPCFPGPEAGQRPDRTAAAAPHAFGVGDTLHTLSLQQWVNAEAGQSAARDVFVLACRRWIGSGRHVQRVIGLEKCHVRKVGFRYYVDLHIVVEGTLMVRRGHNIAHDVEDAVLQQVPQIAEVLVHVEPEEELLTPSLKR